MRNIRKPIICLAAFLCFLAVSVGAQLVSAQQPTPGIQVITAPTGAEILDIISNTVSAGISLATVQNFATEGTGTPALASCGTSPALGTGSTNRVGLVTVGGGAGSGCTVAFSATLPAAPVACLLTAGNLTAADLSAPVPYVSAITTAHFVISGTTTAANLYYHCF